MTVSVFKPTGVVSSGGDVGGGQFLTYAGEVGGEAGKKIYLLLKPAAQIATRKNDKSVSEKGPSMDSSSKDKGIALESTKTIISVFAFNNVQFIKDTLRSHVKALKSIRSEKIKLSYKGIEIKQGKLVNDYNLDGTKEKPTVIEYTTIENRSLQDQAGQDVELVMDDSIVCTKKMETRVHSALIALGSGKVPRLAVDGTGGTYFLPDPRGKPYPPVGCFKPKDEEPCAPNNPRGFPGKENSDGFRPGIYSAQGAFREVAAFILDHKGVAGVPDTALVHARHPKYNNPNDKIIWKTGSFQEFIDAKETAGDFHPSQYATDDVHAIGIFDIRVVNMDRNDGNVLVAPAKSKRGASKYQLIPIDHGLILPDRLEIIEEDIVWMSWPQAKEPFSVESINYVQGLNPDKEVKDAAKYLGISRDPLRLMKCASILMKTGVTNGLTLYDIGTIIYRQDLDLPSIFQDIISGSLDAALLYGGVKGAVSGKGFSHLNMHELNGLNLETTRINNNLGRKPVQARNNTKKKLKDDDTFIEHGMVHEHDHSDSSSHTSSTTSHGKDHATDKGKARCTQSDCSDGWTSPTTSPPGAIVLDIPAHEIGTRETESGSETSSDDAPETNKTTSLGTAIRLIPPDASKSVFSRPDLKGKETVQWTDDLERVFFEYLTQRLESHVERCKAKAQSNNKVPYFGKEFFPPVFGD